MRLRHLVRQHAPNAQVLFDHFRIVKHLNEAVEEVRRSERRRFEREGKSAVQAQPLAAAEESLESDASQKERLSTLVRWNTPIIRAYYLKESFQLFWEYRRPSHAEQHPQRWMNSAAVAPDPCTKFVRMLLSHLDGVLPSTSLRLSNGR